MAEPQPTLLATWDDLVAVAKPAGWRTDGASDEPRSLLGWLPDGQTPVHRLDKATSGVVLCAATADARRRASGWFAAGEVGKTYRALVHGELSGSGRIDRPLQDARRRRALPAVTTYRTLGSTGRVSYVELVPETGRKHQLRRHLRAIGHAIVGDTRYRPRAPRKVRAAPNRLWLHAARLRLPDGREVEAALPPELSAHLRDLGLEA